MNIKALACPLEQDLRPFILLLHQYGINHSVSEERGQQVLLVADQEHVSVVQNLFDRWQQGDVLIVEPSAVDGGNNTSATEQKLTFSQTLIIYLVKLPVTLICIGLSLLIFILLNVSYSKEPLLLALLFQPVLQTDTGVVFLPLEVALQQKEYWRLLTPIFLHFSIMHIVFNMLWLWFLGIRIELSRGSVQMLMLIILTGIGGNLGQYMVNQFYGDVPFGGMSAVIYGLLGYIVSWNFFQKTNPITIEKSIVIFMLAWLFIAMTGVTEWVGLGSVANAAHVAGLLCGVVLGIGQGILMPQKKV